MNTNQSTTDAAARMRNLRLRRRSNINTTRNGDPEFRHPDIVFGFRVNQYCILCGDGFTELRRRCHAHPGICNTCEREYCECAVEGSVKLSALEDIAKYPEEKRIGLLLARKMTLKLAGKLTSAMTYVQPTPDEHTAYVPFRGRKFYPDPDNEGGHAFDNVEKTVEDT